MSQKNHIASLILSLGQVMTGFLLSFTALALVGTEGYAPYLAFTSMAMIAGALIPLGGPDLMMREIAAALAEGGGRRAVFGRMRGLAPALPLMGAGTLIGAWLIDAALQSGFGLTAMVLGATALTQYAAGALRGLGAAVTAQMTALALPPVITSLILLSMSQPADLLVAHLASCLGVLALCLILAGLALLRLPAGPALPRAADLWEMARAALALMCLGALAVMNSNYDMIALNALSTPAELVAFQLAVQGGLLFTVLRGNTGYLATGIIAQWVSCGDDARLVAGAMPMVRRVTVWSGVIYLVMLLSAVPLARALGAQEEMVWRSLTAFAIAGLTFAGTAGFCLIGQLSLHLGRPGLMLKWSVISMLCNLIAAPLLAWQWGAVGVSLSLLVSVVVWNLGLRRDVVALTGLDLTPIGLWRGRTRGPAIQAQGSG